MKIITRIENSKMKGEGNSQTHIYKKTTYYMYLKVLFLEKINNIWSLETAFIHHSPVYQNFYQINVLATPQF